MDDQDRERVNKVRQDTVRRLKQLVLNVFGEWPDYPAEEMLNALDEVRNNIIAGQLDLDDPGDADLEVEGCDIEDDDDPEDEEDD